MGYDEGDAFDVLARWLLAAGIVGWAIVLLFVILLLRGGCLCLY